MPTDSGGGVTGTVRRTTSGEEKFDSLPDMLDSRTGPDSWEAGGSTGKAGREAAAGKVTLTLTSGSQDKPKLEQSR